MIKRRHPLADRGHDLYETPAEMTRALIDACVLPPRSFGYIWEPCAGRGAISRVLQDASYTVCSYDIADYPGADMDIVSGRDFFAETKSPPHCQTIVTNPPYSLEDDFVRHALKLVPTVWVLLPLMRMEGVERSDIIDGHLYLVLVGRDRPPMMHRDGWTGAKARTNAVQYGWFQFRNLPKPVGYQDFKVRRITWRPKP